MGRGFPDRGEAWWRRCLRRLWDHAAGLDTPDCGSLLEADGEIVGALLLVHGRAGTGEAGPRSNLSSWYVEPGQASYAPLLVAQATKRRDTTYFNISPAPHTLPIIEAQGFRRYADDRTRVLAWLAGFRPGARLRSFDPEAPGDRLRPGEAAMLARHQGYGCIALCIDAQDGLHPFLFRPERLRGGVPMATLVYCRDLSAVARFAGPLGRGLMRRGLPLIAIEGDARPAGLAGWYRSGRAPRYVKGPNPPRTGDLTDTERAIFGA